MLGSKIKNIIIIFFLVTLIILSSGCIKTNQENDNFNVKTLVKSEKYLEPIAFSPDGNKILYIQKFDKFHKDSSLTSSNNSTWIWLIDTNGNNNELITECYWHPYDLQFSPDGSKILYVDGNEEFHQPNDIWLMDLIKKENKKLCSARNAIFTSDGQKIIYVADGIWMMNINGSNKIKITDKGLDPYISPDGKMITYSSDECNCHNSSYFLDNHDIYIMNIDGSNHIQLTNNTFPDHSPIFSPKGNYVMFQSNKDSQETWLINISSLELFQLEDDDCISREFTISPNQKMIVYEKSKMGSANDPSDISVMNWNMDKSNKLTDGGLNFKPIFNNDGTKIVYHHMNDWGEEHTLRIIQDKNGKWGL